MNIFERLKRRATPPLRCEDVNGFLIDYIDGTLDAATARRFDAHLDMCPECPRYLEQYRTTIELVKAAPVPNPPAELADLTLSFLKKEWARDSDAASAP